MYRRLIRPLLFLLSPDAAHAAGMAALAPLEHLAALRALARALLAPKDPALRTEALGLTFPSPLGLAGGFDKDARRARALAALGFGFLELGTVTARAQEPNPPPNLFRLPRDRALINRLGFPNQGAERVVTRMLARDVVGEAGIPVGVSIGKSRALELDPIGPVIADYLASFHEARKVADFVVVNVSSPNTKNLRIMQGPAIAQALLSRLVQARDTPEGRRVPLLVKIAPDLTDAELDGLLEVVERVGIEGVVATNTTIARTGLLTDPRRVEVIGAGGLSGPPLRNRARAIVRRARASLGNRAVIIGVGGVETAEDVLDFMRAGANLVQMYTGFIYGGPLAPSTIGRRLVRLVAREGVRTVSELVGTGEGASYRPMRVGA